MNRADQSQQEAGPNRDFGRPPTEREVLRVLWAASPGKHLVRSQIHKKMPQMVRPTLGRIGQILSALYGEGLLEKVDGRAQGARKAGFYGLTDRGRQLCRQLGFEHQERLLFSVPDETLRACLTRERLSRQTRGSGRIIAVYGCRGGLGRTTLVAHLGKGLAERLDSDNKLLVVDLDLRVSGLNDYFASSDLERCRGLGGLLVDYERREEHKRPLWLRGALNSPQYALRPLPKVPGLVFLPSGLSPGQDALSPSERAEALALLRAKVGPGGAASSSEPGEEAGGFLEELRNAILDQYSRAVIDTDSGWGLGAWVATRFLADQLVLCAQVAETGAGTFSILRTVLASFLYQREKSSSPGQTLFLFRLAEPTNREDLDEWIERHLVMEGAQLESPASYRAEQLPYDARLSRQQHRWANTHFFKHVIAQIDPTLTGNVGISPPPPELQALLTVLDPEASGARRSIAAGILENVPFQELARSIDWYLRDTSLHRATDVKGEEMVKFIAKNQAKLLKNTALKLLEIKPNPP